jgi:hypothetical protein
VREEERRKNEEGLVSEGGGVYERSTSTRPVGVRCGMGGGVTVGVDINDHVGDVVGNRKRKMRVFSRDDGEGAQGGI